MFNRLKKLLAALGSSLTGRRVPPVMTGLARDERGVIIVMFALLLPIMIGFIGLGVEVAYWFQDRRELQAAADAGAIAGSFEIAEGRVSAADTVAQREAEANGWSSSEGTITVNNNQVNSTFPSSGNFDTDSNAIEVILTRTINPLFIGYFMDNLTFTAGAVATVVAGASTACILALGQPASPGGNDPADAVKVSGNATVTMTGCNVSTNSTDDKAVNVTSGLTVDCIYSAGGVNISGSGSPTTTACSGPKTNQPAVTDPYETAPPTKPVDSDFANCGSDGLNADGANYIAPPSADIFLDQGVYCDILFSRNNDTLTLSAGTYYIDRGSFEVKAGGVIDGTAGVTIVFGDSTGGNDCGGFKIAGSSFVNLTAPITEQGFPFTGLAIYRSSNCDKDEKFEFTGSTTSTILGAVYNPSGEIKITGTGSLDGTCLQIIANTVEFSGDSGIGSTCDNVDIQTVDAGSKGSLVE